MTRKEKLIGILKRIGQEIVFLAVNGVACYALYHTIKYFGWGS